MAVVARLLRGEPLEVVAREANVSVAKLTEWRDRALAGAASALKERDRSTVAWTTCVMSSLAGPSEMESLPAPALTLRSPKAFGSCCIPAPAGSLAPKLGVEKLVYSTYIDIDR